MPRGAAASSRSPARTRVCRNWLPAPCGSRLTLMRYSRGARAARTASSCAAAAAAPGRAQAQGQELSGQGGRHARAVGIGQLHRDHRVALPARSPVTASGRNPGHAGGGLAAVRPALPAAPRRPGWSSISWNEAFQPALSAGIRSARSTCCAGMPGQVQQRVDLRDRHALRAGGDLDDLVPGLAPRPRSAPGNRTRAGDGRPAAPGIRGSSMRMPTR